MRLDVEDVVDGGVAGEELWTDPCDLNFCCFRFRRRMTKCEFSARLLACMPPGRCRSVRPRSRAAARYEASISVTIVSGWMPWFLSNFLSSFSAAALLRRS